MHDARSRTVASEAMKRANLKRRAKNETNCRAKQADIRPQALGMSRSVLIIEAAVGGFDIQAAASESSIEAVCSA
jgi:hypothetical protein